MMFRPNPDDKRPIAEQENEYLRARLREARRIFVEASNALPAGWAISERIDAFLKEGL